jgi:hypothetical protein
LIFTLLFCSAAIFAVRVASKVMQRVWSAAVAAVARAVPCTAQERHARAGRSRPPAPLAPAVRFRSRLCLERSHLSSSPRRSLLSPLRTRALARRDGRRTHTVTDGHTYVITDMTAETKGPRQCYYQYYPSMHTSYTVHCTARDGRGHATAQRSTSSTARACSLCRERTPQDGRGPCKEPPRSRMVACAAC